MKKLRAIVLWLILGAAAPLLLQAQTTETYTFTTNRLVPDGNPAGLSDVRTINSAITSISSVTVQLQTTGQFNGDLYGYLVHSSGFTVLLNRPGKTASNPFGYADSGLNVTFQTGAANGDIHIYHNVTIPAPGTPLTGIWQPDGRDVDPMTVLDTSPQTTSLTNFVGLTASGGWTLFLADMESGGTNELTQWSLTIVGVSSPTLTWSNPAGITYGTALGASQLNANATYNSTNVPGTFTYNPPAGTILKAGSGQTLSVTFTPSNSVAFLPVTTNVTIDVTPAPLTITSGLTVNNKIYDKTTTATLSSNSVVLSGVVVGDTVSLNTNGYTANFVSAGVGNGIAVTVSGLTLSGASQTNYTLTQPASLNANITVAPVTISSGLTANNKIYNKTTTATLSSNSVVLSGVVGGDTVSLNTNGYTANFASAGVGNGIAVTVSGLTLSGASQANYSLTQPASLSANITVAPVTISSGLTANNKIYNKTTTATLSSNSVVLSGVVGGDTVSLNTNGYTANFTSAGVGNGIAVTVSGLTLSGASQANYSLTQPASLSANITVAPVTISSGLTANNKTYDKTTTATLSSNSVVLSGVVGGDTVSLNTNGYTANFASAGVGNGIAVTVSGLTLSGASQANYSLTQPASLSANITVAPVTISSGLTANNKVYNGTTPATLSSNSVVLSGVVGGDTVSLNTNAYTANFASAGVGNGIAVTVSGLTLSGASQANYSLTQPSSLSANITVAPVTISSGLTANNKIYNKTTTATLSSNSVVLSGVVGGDTVSLNTNGYTANFASAGVGNGIAVTVSGLTLSGASQANYSLTQPASLSANITVAPVTISSGLTANNKTYDKTTTATLSSNSVVLSGVVGGDTVSLNTNGYTANFTSAGVGNGIAVTVSGLTLSGASQANYSLTQPASLSANITVATVTISSGLTANNKVYNGTTPATLSSNSVVLSGVVGGDTVSLNTNGYTANFISAGVGNGIAVTVSGLTLSGTSQANYSLTQPASLSANIIQSTTTGMIVSSANPVLPGTGVTFTLTVSPVAPGAGTPVGNVNFRINGIISGTGTLSGGVAVFATNGLPYGSNTVVAEYAGSQNFVGITNSLSPVEVIDTPPTAGNFTIQRYPTQGVKVSLATIVSNCSDPDGTTLTANVASTSANGGTITVTQGWASYTPPAGFTNGDSFTYTVTDGYGETTMGTITVAIEVDNSAAQNLIITALGGGSFLINGNGIPGYTYMMQYSTTLNPANWQNITDGSVTADSTGSFQFTNSPSGGTGFYRIVYP